MIHSKVEKSMYYLRNSTFFVNIFQNFRNKFKELHRIIKEKGIDLERKIKRSHKPKYFDGNNKKMAKKKKEKKKSSESQ